MLDEKQQIQDDAYEFPYHYIATAEPFSYLRMDGWGWQYVSFIDFFLRELEKRGARSLIDVGCGDGRLLHEVAKKRPHMALAGVDYSARAIRLASALNPQLEFICADIAELAQQGRSYDVVSLIEVLEHVEPTVRAAFLESVAKLVKPDGVLLLSVPHVNRPPDPRHYEHFTLERLTAVLAANFDIIETAFVEPVAPRYGLKWVFKLVHNRFWCIVHPSVQKLVFESYRRGFVVDSQAECYRLFVAARVKRPQP